MKCILCQFSSFRETPSQPRQFRSASALHLDYRIDAPGQNSHKTLQIFWHHLAFDLIAGAPRTPRHNFAVLEVANSVSLTEIFGEPVWKKQPQAEPVTST
jgi:hypothetical protein